MVMTTAVIVAGGRSRRFGSDKALYEVAGYSMISRVASALGQVFSDIIVAGGDVPRIESLGFRCYPDEIPERGVLGGLYTGLTHAESSQIFLCACDMPLIMPLVVRAVLNSTSSAPVTLPEVDGIRQPLHAIYDKRILPIVQRLLTKTDLFLPALFDQVEISVPKESTFAHIPDYRHSFLSINDPETLQQYEAIIKLRTPDSSPRS